jgi:hypothetical protein
MIRDDAVTWFESQLAAGTALPGMASCRKPGVDGSALL